METHGGLRAELRVGSSPRRRPGRGVPGALAEVQGALAGDGRSGTRATGGGASARPSGTSLAEQEVDLIDFDHLHTAQLLPDARAVAPRARAVMDAHNIEAQVAERLAEVSRWPLKRGPAPSGRGHRPARDPHRPGAGRGALV